MNAAIRTLFIFESDQSIFSVHPNKFWCGLKYEGNTNKPTKSTQAIDFTQEKKCFGFHFYGCHNNTLITIKISLLKLPLSPITQQNM